MAPKPGSQEQPTLCWGCTNTNRHKCSWFNPDNPQPVPGWVAELRPKSRIGESYLVKECPKFEPEPVRKTPEPVRKPPEPKPERKARRHTPYKTSSSYPGVQEKKHHWVARIAYKGQRYYLGYFKTEEEAIAARKAAEEAIARGETPCKQ